MTDAAETEVRSVQVPAVAPQTAGERRELGPISAVVCSFNGEDYLPECLDALLALGSELDEIVVVDNGSTDASLTLLGERYPGVAVVALPVNGGPGSARNAGMRAAKNRWVLAIDNDVVVERDTLAKLRHALEASDDVCVAQPRSLVADDPSTVHYDGARFHYVGLFSLRNFFQPRAAVEAAPGGLDTLAVDGFISLCGLLDRKRVLELGGYDETLFILFEDHDLSLRLRLAGEGIVSVESATVLHKSGTPGISFRDKRYPQQRAFFHSRNRWLLLVKCHRWRTLFVSLPGLVVYETAWFGFNLLSGHLFSYLRGKAAFFRQLPGALSKRRRIQSTRVVSDSELLVAGPLTLSPQLVEKPVAAKCARVLDVLLSAWWRLAGRLAA